MDRRLAAALALGVTLGAVGEHTLSGSPSRPVPAFQRASIVLVPAPDGGKQIEYRACLASTCWEGFAPSETAIPLVEAMLAGAPDGGAR